MPPLNRKAASLYIAPLGYCHISLFRKKGIESAYYRHSMSLFAVYL